MEVTSPPSTLLPIDECEEWIWDILDSTKDSGFEYVVDEDKEFLIFNTNDFHADPKALYKIRRLTGMRLAQMSTRNCYTQLWFCRSSHFTNIHSYVITQIAGFELQNPIGRITPFL